MAAFHIWNAGFVGADPVVLECHVTRGESLALARGSDRFAAASLRALGVVELPRRWSLVAMRSHYFSSYRATSGAWLDRWDLVWRLRVELGGVAALARVPDWGYFDVDEVDDSYRSDDDPEDRPSWPCLVVADFADALALVEARSIVTRLCPTASLATGLAFGRIPQLRCDLGPRPRAFYQAGAAEAEQLLAALVEAGASVHFETSLP